MTRRTRRSIAGSVLVVVALVFGAVIVTALRAEGRERSEARTNDGGAWLLKRDEGYVGHVNHAVKELTAAVNVAQAGADFDVDQADDVIVVQDRTAGAVVLIENSAQVKGSTVQVAADLRADAVDGGVLLINEATLAAYRFTRDEFAAVADTGLEGIEPVVEGEGPGRAASFTDGHAVLVDQAAGQVVFVDPGGGVRRSPATELTDAVLSVTALGPDTAVFTDADGDLFVATPDEIRNVDVDLGDEAGPLLLQQPGVASDRVVAAAVDGRLLSIPLAEGTDGPTELTPLPAGGPVAPIVFKGCVFAVSTAGTPTFLQQCGDDFEEQRPLDGAGSELRLREVNGWIWINDVDSGGAWVTEPERRIEQLEDWDVILSSLSEDPTDPGEQPDPGDEVETVVDPDDPTAEIIQSDEIDESEENVPPVANDDEASTRVERPVEVDVLANDTDLNQDPLLVTEVVPTGGSAVVTMASDGSSVQVAPDAGYVGPVTFDYSISDGRSDPVSASATVDVLAADGDSNRPPEPQNDIASTRRGRPTTFDVLANDDDPEGDALVLQSIELADPQATAGEIVANPSGQVVFTPDPNTRTDRIELTYVVSDDYNATAQASVVVAVRLAASNNEPDARNDAARTVADKPVRLDVLHNDTDPDRDPLYVDAQPILQAPTDVTIESLDVTLTADGELYFNPDRAGTFVFQYSVSDGQASDLARIRVDVGEAVDNRAPVAVRDDVVIPAGGSRLVHVLDNDGDPDGDVVSIVGNTVDDGITVKEIDGVGFLVTAAADAAARSVFQYSITDGLWAEPITATVVVAVTDADIVDQPPVANDDVAEVRAGSRISVGVLDNDSDPENGVLLVSSVTAVDGVTAEPGLNGQTVSVDVGPGVVGSFTLGYTVVDEAGNGASAYIRVRVVPSAEPNRPPVARSDTARTQSGTPIVIDVRTNDQDPDGDLFVLEAVTSQPSGGQALVEDGVVRYTPAETLAGTDRLSYSIVDSNGAVAIGEVLIGVTPRPGQNRAPEAFDDQISVLAGSAPVIVDVLANDSDSDRDPLTVTTVGAPSAGATRIDDGGGAVVVTPPDTVPLDDGTRGGAGGTPLEMTVPYSIADGRDGTSSAVITITVTTAGAPVPPEAVEDLRGPLTPGEVIEVDLLANDVDPDGNPAELTVTSDDPALAALADGVVTYTAGADSGRHRYTVTDADGLTATAELSVLVVDNRAPELAPLALEVAADEPVTIDVAADAGVTDPDGDPLFYACCDGLSGGSAAVDVTGGEGLVVEFTPDAGFSGPASFNYTVDDQRGHVVSGSVAIEVLAPANRPPVVTPGTFDVEAGTPTPIDLTALVADPDGVEGLSFSLGAPDNDVVTFTGSGGAVTASAAIDTTGGTTVVPFTVTDTGGETVSSTLTITVTAPDAPPPVAVADAATTNQEQAVGVDVLRNDVDPLGGGLTIASVAADGNGTAVAAGGRVTFTPGAGFFGTATFRYTIRDVAATPERESTGQVAVEVIGRPGAPGTPVAVPGNATAVVTWTAPAANGASIEEYAVRVNGAGDGVSAGGATSYSFSGLQNGAPVSFSVRARNAAGWGDWSAASAEVTPDIEPAQPAAPRVTFADSALAVQWSPPPANGGSAVLGYNLRIGGGGLNRVVELGNGTSYTWEGLQNGTKYTFQVQARNAKGVGAWSNSSAPENPLTAPPSPSQPNGERGDGFIVVSFTPSGTGGDPITNYQISREGSGDVAQTTQLSYRWSNLPNGQAQSFRVRAYNRGGWGSWSAASAPVVPCGAPTAPTGVQATAGDGRATVTWGAASPNGCQLASYQVTSNDGRTTTVGGGTTSAEFANLSNGTSYTFSVRATNEVGTGPTGGPSNAVVPAGPPFPTTITAARPGVREVALQWDRPNSNGAEIGHFELQVNGGGWEHVGNVTSYTRGGLGDGQRYTFRVRAVNAVGAGTSANSMEATTFGRPDRVGGLRVTSPGRYDIAASWNRPQANGTPITHYVVDGPTMLENYRDTARTWSGLQPSTRYTVRVRACNAVGCGDWSATEAATTPDPPPPPDSVRVSKGRSAVGQPDCSTSPCRFLHAELSGLPANRSYQVDCFSSAGGQFDTGNATIRTNGSGNFSGDLSCYYGFPGNQVWFTIDGRRSDNTVTW